MEFISQLPANLKINNGWTKYILRSSFEYLLPKEITWRTDKVGYEPPQNKWMENLLIKDRLHIAIQNLKRASIIGKDVSLGKFEKNGHFNTPVLWQLLMADQLMN